MSRGFDRDDERPIVTGPASAHGHPDMSARPREQALEGRRRASERAVVACRSPVPLPSTARRTALTFNRHTYRLRGSESQVLDVLGTFRVVFERDLAENHYVGSMAHLRQDLRSLGAQRLVVWRSLAADRKGRRERVVTLSEEGKRLVEHYRIKSRFSSRSAAPVYAGWGKRSELVHDASLYRMFVCEAERLASKGGRIHRVILDDELKRRLFERANRFVDETPQARQDRLADVARAEGLTVVDGHVQLPDIRIEYEIGGERGRVDLELTTDHYRAGHLAAKQQAGFTLYSATGHAGRGVSSLRRSGGSVPFDPHFVSGLLSL
jgi:hypothetical protein